MKYISGVASIQVFRDNCTGCGRCIEVCPHGVLEIDEKKVFITDADLCMECGACMTNCSFNAVRVNTGVGCASAIINSMINGGEPVCGCSAEEGSGGCC